MASIREGSSPSYSSRDVKSTDQLIYGKAPTGDIAEAMMNDRPDPSSTIGTRYAGGEVRRRGLGANTAHDIDCIMLHVSSPREAVVIHLVSFSSRRVQWIRKCRVLEGLRGCNDMSVDRLFAGFIFLVRQARERHPGTSNE